MTDLDAYFERIGYPHELKPTLEVLQQLHSRHPVAIAFENLSPFLGLEVRLDIDSLQDKLIRKGRGGYCFEHNLLFSHILKSLGFEVQGLAARVLWNVPNQLVLPRTHMLLLVKIGDIDYIADVGFGGLTLTTPLRLDTTSEQHTPHETFRLSNSNEMYTLHAKIANEWKQVYVFDLQQQHQSDYNLVNWYVSNHPESCFVTELIAAKPSNDRRHTLINNQYSIHHRDGSTERRKIQDIPELVDVLETDLCICLDNLPDFEQSFTRLVTGCDVR